MPFTAQIVCINFSPAFLLIIGSIFSELSLSQEHLVYCTLWCIMPSRGRKHTFGCAETKKTPFEFKLLYSFKINWYFQ